MLYLLDTNVLSALVRDPVGPVKLRIESVGETAVGTSIISAAELRFGAERRGSARLIRQVDAVLGEMAVLPLEEPFDRVYASLRTRMESVGAVIGGYDLLIAAHALALGLTLVTDNEREFLRVPELAVENWLRAG
jgi:tRNA(fMet)-specific endonuclease VapC